MVSSPPVALPVRTAVLDGSHSTDDKGGVSYLWSRDDTSPAAGVSLTLTPTILHIRHLQQGVCSLSLQDVLNNSDHQAVLFLGNLVEGKYSFRLTVTDSKGQSSVGRGTVEVKAGMETHSVAALAYVSPGSPLWLSDLYERDLVELVLEVAVSQISQRQRDMLLRQIGVLLGVLDSDIVVREIGAFNEYRCVRGHHFVLL